MRRAILIAIGALALAGCHRHLDARWADVAAPTGDKSANEAVELLHRSEYLLDSDSPTGYRHLEQRVIHVLTENGRRTYSHGKYLLGKDETMVGFQARTISPDGKIHEIGKDDAIQDTMTIVADSASPDDDRHIDVPVVLWEFPEVDVGSTLDYTLVIERRHWSSSIENFCSAEIPVKRCEAEVLYANGIHGEMNVYNSDAKPVAERADTEFRRVKLAVNDIPAWPDEAYARSTRLRDPWWMFHVKYYSDKNGNDEFLNGWDRAVRRIADDNLAENDDLTADFKLTLSKEGCANRACIVERAAKMIREHIDSVWRPGIKDLRPLKQVWDGATGDTRELAVLEWYLLTSAGVDARLALMTRPDIQRLDMSSPSSWWFDHWLVYIPAEKDGQQPTWLDPACDTCAVGQLRRWAIGGEALVLDARKDLLRGVVVQASFAPVDGEFVAPAEVITSAVVKLEPNGDASAEFEQGLTSAAAQNERWRIRGFDDNARTFDAARFVTSRWSPAIVRSSEASTCEKMPAMCHRRVSAELPALATPTVAANGAKGFVVPLALLGHAWESTFRRLERTDDIEFPVDESFADSATIEPPADSRCTWQQAQSGLLPIPGVGPTRAVEASVGLSIEGQKLVVLRTLRFHAGIYPKAEFDSIRRSIEAFTAARRLTVACMEPPPAAPLPQPTGPVVPPELAAPADVK